MKNRTYYLAGVVAGLAVFCGYFYWINNYPTSADYRLANDAVALLSVGDIKGCKHLGDDLFAQYLDLDLGYYKSHPRSKSDQYPSHQRLINALGATGGEKGIWSRWAKKYGANLQLFVFTKHREFCDVADEKGNVFFQIHRVGKHRYLTKFAETLSTSTE